MRSETIQFTEDERYREEGYDDLYTGAQVKTRLDKLCSEHKVSMVYDYDGRHSTVSVTLGSGKRIRYVRTR